MRFLILAYNPKFVNPTHLEVLAQLLFDDLRCKVYFIEHMNDEEDSIYTVQMCDTLPEILH